MLSGAGIEKAPLSFWPMQLCLVRPGETHLLSEAELLCCRSGELGVPHFEEVELSTPLLIGQSLIAQQMSSSMSCVPCMPWRLSKPSDPMILLAIAPFP